VNLVIKRKIFQSIIPAVIILSLLHNFINEYAVFAMWSIASITALLCAGVVFDLIFAVEFIVKSIKAAGRKEFLIYIKHKKGWIDILSSFPVLILYSVPLFCLLLKNSAEIGTLSPLPFEIMSVVITIRMPLILRSIRVVKLFGIKALHNSEMTRHHSSAAGTVAVITAAVVIMLWSGITGFSDPEGIKKRSSDYSRLLVELESAATLNNLDFRDLCENILISDHRLIRINYNNGKRYEKLSESEFSKYYNSGDYIKVSGELCSLTISVKDLKKENARLNMMFFLVLLGPGVAFMLLYSRHFSITVSDVAGALNSGFRKRDYNLMIKIRNEYKEEELYRLAQFYNDVYLPAKLRKRDFEKEGSGTPITMDAVKQFDENGS